MTVCQKWGARKSYIQPDYLICGAERKSVVGVTIFYRSEYVFSFAQGEQGGTRIGLPWRLASINSHIRQQHTRLSKQDSFLADKMKMSEGVVPSDRRQKLLGSDAAEVESLSDENESLQHKL